MAFLEQGGGLVLVYIFPDINYFRIFVPEIQILRKSLMSVIFLPAQFWGWKSGKKKAHRIKKNPRDTGRVCLGHLGGQTGLYRLVSQGLPVAYHRKTDTKGPFYRDTDRVSQGYPAVQGVFRNFMWFFIVCLFCSLENGCANFMAAWPRLSLQNYCHSCSRVWTLFFRITASPSVWPLIPCPIWLDDLKVVTRGCKTSWDPGNKGLPRVSCAFWNPFCTGATL